MEMLKRFEPVLMVIVLLGALNWGMVGLFDTNVLAEVFTSSTILDVVYVVVGIAGILCIPRLLEELHVGGHHPRPHGA